MTRRLNGWQRLWVVVAVLLLLPFLFANLMELSSGGLHTAQVAFYGLLIWAGLAVMIYLLGVAVTWVRRGFASKGT